MTFLTDYTNIPDNIQLYGGNAGFKKGITIDGVNWIIKFPQETSTFSNVDISFTTAPLSEYVGSHIYDILGYKVHNTKLGVCNNELINRKQLVVACEDFTCNGKYTLVDYETIKNNYSDELQAKLIEVKNNLPSYSSEGISTHTIPIEEIMVQFNENEIFKTCPEIKNLFWDMLVIDYIINNNDRNKNNWGLLKDNNTNSFVIAPVYDNGASFVSKHTDEKLERLLNDEKALDNSVLNGMCYYTIDNKLVNFLNLFKGLRNRDLSLDLDQAIERVKANINNKWGEIKNFINDIPETENDIEIISKTKKNFFIKSMKIRIDNI